MLAIVIPKLFAGLGRVNWGGLFVRDLGITLVIAFLFIAVAILPGLRSGRQSSQPATPTIPPSEHPLFDRQLDRYPV